MLSSILCEQQGKLLNYLFCMITSIVHRYSLFLYLDVTYLDHQDDVEKRLALSWVHCVRVVWEGFRSCPFASLWRLWCQLSHLLLGSTLTDCAQGRLEVQMVCHCLRAFICAISPKRMFSNQSIGLLPSGVCAVCSVVLAPLGSTVSGKITTITAALVPAW